MQATYISTTASIEKTSESFNKKSLKKIWSHPGLFFVKHLEFRDQIKDPGFQTESLISEI